MTSATCLSVAASGSARERRYNARRSSTDESSNGKVADEGAERFPGDPLSSADDVSPAPAGGGTKANSASGRSGTWRKRTRRSKGNRTSSDSTAAEKRASQKLECGSNR